MKVMYQGQVVGDYIADLIVNDCVIVEIKSIKHLEQVHVAQGLNYLKATGLPLCLLINFGTPKVEIKRIINGV
jgi:GxxExxY protein